MLQAERIAAAAGGTLLEQPLQRRDPADGPAGRPRPGEEAGPG